MFTPIVRTIAKVFPFGLFFNIVKSPNPIKEVGNLLWLVGRLSSLDVPLNTKLAVVLKILNPATTKPLLDATKVKTEFDILDPGNINNFFSKEVINNDNISNKLGSVVVPPMHLRDP